MLTRQAQTCLVVLYPGCIVYEVMLAVELLRKTTTIVAISPDGEPVPTCGFTVAAPVAYGDVNLDGVQAILVPGGDPESVMQDATLASLLIEANLRRIIIGAICAGPVLLARAGILKGRQTSHGYEAEQLAFLADDFAGALLTDDPLSIDGHIVTAKPGSHIDFGVEIAFATGVVASAKQAACLCRYYKGLPVENDRC